MTDITISQQSAPFLSYIEREPSFRNLTKDGGAAFLWYQLLAEHLCSTAYEISAITDMEKALIAFYHDHPNEKGVSILELVLQEYHADAAIVLYTDAKYKISMILNKALKSENLDTLYDLRAYVHDLSDQLRHNKDVQLQPHDSVFHLYHGRHMSNIDLERLKTAPKGSLICVNGYLSTSKSEDVAKRYANDVLFDISYRPSHLTSVHAADVSQKSAHPEEEEVLFNLNSVFELGDIKDDSNADVILKPIIRVFLTATDKGSEILKNYIEIMKNERCENQSTTFARLLCTMGEYPQALIYCERMLKQLDIEHARPRPLEAAAVYNIIATCYYNSIEDMCQAERNLNIALDIEHEHQLDDHVFVCDTLRQLGAVYERRCHWAKALEFYEGTLRMSRCLACSNNPSDMVRFAAAYNNIGIVYDLTHRYEKAKFYYNLARKTYKEAFNTGGKDYHHAIAETLNNLACVYDTEGDYDTSQKLHEEILDIYRDTLGNRHLNVGKTYVNYGATFYCLGKFRDALRQFDKALRIYTSNPMRPNQLVATVWSNIGESYRAVNETTRAIEYLAKGFHLRLNVHKNELEKNLDVAMSYKILAEFYMNKEELRLAYIYAQRALEIFLKSVGSDKHPDIASTYNILGEIARRLGKTKKSMRLHETAFIIFFYILPQNHIMVADCFYLAAKTHLDQKNYSRALFYCIYAKAIYNKCASTHPNLSEILSIMARTYEAQCDFIHTDEYDQKAIQQAMACRDNTNPMLLATYYNHHGSNCYRTQKYNEAFKSWGRARELRLLLVRKRKERRASSINFYLDLQTSCKRRSSI